MNNMIKEKSLSKPNILIIEHSKLIYEVLCHKLKSFASNFFNTVSLNESYKIIEKNKIDYIFLDINLPDGDSYELIKKYENTNIKIFVLTTEASKNFREKLLKKGVIDFIIKDSNFFYNLPSIIKTIDRLERNKNKTILVIDDSIVIQEQLKEMFTHRNYNIITASNLDIAFDKIVEKKIDLIILDVQLKNENGIDFLRKYHTQIIAKRDIPVIIISGFVDSTIIRDGLHVGAVDVLRKPLIQEELTLKVDLWIDYKRKENEVMESTKLINQYKETVDRSFIVSKSDPEGHITYVNNEFCKVSGYSKEELINTKHNIIRHEDTNKKRFKRIWETIKVKKRPWRGKIKNKTKSGESYWITTIINPVLDSQNNIIEYIAVSNNITEHEKVKDYFKNQLNTSTENLTQAINLSTEYKRAMYESSIVSRTDLNGIITYANDKFIEISEYSKEELIGNNHNIVQHPNQKKDIFSQLWRTIKRGNTWNGIIKNMSKSGKTYWVNSTIVPIRDKNKEVIEYMCIRNDITNLFELHEEINNTQKEIIYRMGEIGETRSKETGNHVKRVAEYSKLLAIHSNLNDDEIDILFTASPMHDIGKVGISDSILKKPGKLTSEEYEIMKEHAMIGYNILKGSERKVLRAAAIVSKEHHEKWDGTGYPQGLKGEGIHIFGRITAVADVFDALISDRCYKKAWPSEKVLNFFEEEKGKSFDPKLVDILLDNIHKFFEIKEKYKD